ncbi:hypothetical protein ACRAWF_42810 [Streptomyces sp. L7]
MTTGSIAWFSHISRSAAGVPDSAHRISRSAAVVADPAPTGSSPRGHPVSHDRRVTSARAHPSTP